MALTSGSASTGVLSPPDEVDSLILSLSPRSVRTARGRLRTAAGSVAAGRPGQRICHHIVRARYVLDIACEFGNVCQLAALLGCPRFSRPANSGGEQLVVCVQREPPSLQHEPEMADGLEAGQQLPVES